MEIRVCLILLMPIAVWSFCESPFEQVGDQCLYIEPTIELSFVEAKEYCKEMDNATLGTISTATQFKAVVDHIFEKGLSISPYWLDGSDSAAEGKWISSAGDDIPMGTPFWAGFTDYQEPNNLGEEDCLIFNTYYYLNDINCGDRYKPICEARESSGSVYQNRSAEDNPCPLHFVEIGGQCLSFHTWQSVTWGEAKSSCSGNEQLAAINDIEVLRGIYLYLHQAGLVDHDFWIGGTDEVDDGNWKWLDGSSVPMGTPFWGLGTKGQEPDGGTDENYLSLVGRCFYYFRDVRGDRLYHPLCMLVQ